MNLVLPIIALPIAIFGILSIQIAERVGFRKLIMISSFFYSVSTILSSFTENIYVFTLLYNFIPAIALSLSMYPVIFCVWSWYPEIKGKISGYMFGVFQLSTLFYTVIGTMIANPNNKSATEKIVDENNNVLNYYDEEVANNVGKMILILGIIYFCLGGLGSYLIKPVVVKEKEVEQSKKNYISSEVEMNTKYEAFMEEKNIISDKQTIKTNECPDVKSGIMTRTFLILFINSGLVAALALYLNINFKTFSLTRLNNDYYVTYLYIFNAIAGGIGRFFWGHIIDKYSFKSVLIVLEVMVFMNGIIFPFATNVFFYCTMIFLMAFFDGGLMSIIGPGLLSIYGLNIGAKLLPIKGLSFFIGLMICPIIGILLEGRFGTGNVFFVLGLLNIIGVVLSFFIKTNYNWYRAPKENEKN